MAKSTNSLNIRLDSFYQALAECSAERASTPGRDVWPQPVFDISEGDAHLYPELLYRYYTPLLMLQFDRKSIDELASKFQYPGRPLHFLYLFMIPTMSQSEALLRTSVSTTFIAVIERLRHGNLKCKGGQNKVLSDDQLHQLTDSSFIDIEDTDVLSRDTIGEMNVLLSSYQELLYFAYLAYGREIHGPYVYSENEVVLVRDYYDFSPDIYEQTGHLNASTIRIATVYPKEVKISIDTGGRLDSDRPLGPNLRKVQLFVDEKSSNPQEIMELNKSLTSAVTKLSEEVRSYERQDLLRAWVEMQFWATKPLLDWQEHNDWRPPEQVYQRIGSLENPGGALMRQKDALGDMGHNERIQNLKRILDPRYWGKNNDQKLTL